MWARGILVGARLRRALNLYQLGPALRAGLIKNETLRTATERHPYPSADLSTFFSPPAPVARFHFSTFAPFHFCTTSLFALHLSATLAHLSPNPLNLRSPCHLANLPTCPLNPKSSAKNGLTTFALLMLKSYVPNFPRFWAIAHSLSKSARATAIGSPLTPNKILTSFV